MGWDMFVRDVFVFLLFLLGQLGVVLLGLLATFPKRREDGHDERRTTLEISMTVQRSRRDGCVGLWVQMSQGEDSEERCGPKAVRSFDC